MHRFVGSAVVTDMCNQVSPAERAGGGVLHVWPLLVQVGGTMTLC